MSLSWKCCLLLLLLKPAITWAQDKTNQKFSYRLVRNTGKTWGYDIYSGKKCLIHQTTIPAVAGDKGFKRKSDAGKTALLVISKLEQGIMPPTISLQELASNNIPIQP